MGKKVKRKFNFKKFLTFILMLVIIILGIIYIFNLRIKNIVVLNNNYYNDEVIIETANLENYPKILRLSRDSIRNKLKKLDLVEEVGVKKKFGSILELNIKEKKVLYFVRSSDKYKVSDGKEYELSKLNGIPTLINYIPEDIEKKFITKFERLDSTTISLISEIEYSKTEYDSGRFLLYMNDGNEVYITISRLENLDKYEEIVKKLDGKKGILYLDSGNYFEIKEN